MQAVLAVDDPAVAGPAEAALRAGLFDVLSIYPEEIVELAAFYAYDLVVIDQGLVDKHGLDLLRALRADRPETPAIVLSDLADAGGLARELGADDVVGKPFQPADLTARARALALARLARRPPVEFAGLSIDRDRKRALVQGNRVFLYGAQFRFLECLAERPGALVTNEFLRLRMFGDRDEPELKIVDVFAYVVRKKLWVASGETRNYIRTEWGVGHALVDPDVRRD